MHLNHPHDAPLADTIDFSQFSALDIRIGTNLSAEAFPEARKLAYKLSIDFGPGVGGKRPGTRITKYYQLRDLTGRRVAAVVNFPPWQTGKFMSGVLTLGFPDAEGEVALFAPDKDVPDGSRLF